MPTLPESETYSSRKTQSIFPGNSQEGRDVWAHQEMMFTNGDCAEMAPSYGALMLRDSAK
jgi:hypothetical protein